MKKKIYFILLLFIVGSLTSCEKNDLDYKNDLETSRKVWLSFKKSNNNSYKYVVSGGSVLVTYGWKTTITVSNGIITQRDFRYTSGAEKFVPKDQLEWTENENKINSKEHDHTSASKALTLDQIYDKAKQDWLVNTKNGTILLEVKNNGLISTCGYTIVNCIDDCFVGIIIESIDAL